MPFKSDKQRKKVMADLNSHSSSHVSSGSSPATHNSNSNKMLGNFSRRSDPDIAESIWNNSDSYKKEEIIFNGFPTESPVDLQSRIDSMSVTDWGALTEKEKDRVMLGIAELNLDKNAKLSPEVMIGNSLTKLMSDMVAEKMKILHSPEVENMDVYSKREIRELMSYVDDQITNGAFQSYNWEDIIKSGAIDKEINSLVHGNLKEQVDDFVKQSFGYDEPSKRPSNKAEKIVAALSEPYEEMKDERYTFLGDRRKINYEIVKRQIDNYMKFIANDLKNVLPTSFK